LGGSTILLREPESRISISGEIQCPAPAGSGRRRHGSETFANVLCSIYRVGFRAGSRGAGQSRRGLSRETSKSKNPGQGPALRTVYNAIMPKDVIHISESEAATDFAKVMTRVREGREVIIERDAKPVAIVRPAEPLRGRPISESIALAEAHAKQLGYEPAMDPDFAADLEEIIKSRKPRNISTWE